MAFYTHVRLGDEQAKLILKDIGVDFPSSPEIGQMALVGGVLYVYSKIGSGVNSWYPLTNYAENYVHQQISANTTWTVTHNLGSQNIAYFVYDDSGSYVISEIEFIDDNSFYLHFSEAIAGRVVVFASTNAFSQGQTTIIYVDKYAEKLIDHGSVTGTLNISTEDGLVHKVATSGALEISFSGWATGSRSSALTLNITRTGTDVITFPNVLWPDGYAPVFSEDSLNRLIFVSDDGGTTIQGFVAGLNIRVSE